MYESFIDVIYLDKHKKFCFFSGKYILSSYPDKYINLFLGDFCFKSIKKYFRDSCFNVIKKKFLEIFVFVNMK